MLSGHGQARTIVEAMRLGASDFLRKPFEVEELELAFQKALEKRALEAGGGGSSAAACAPRPRCCSSGGDNREDARGARDHRAGRRHRHHGADPRRERHRQGGRRPRALPARASARPALRQGELRGAPRRSCSRASSSASRRAPSPAPRSASSASSSSPTTAPSSSTRSARCTRRSRRSCCRCCRTASSRGSAARADVRVDTRIIAATNRNLEEAVAGGRRSARTSSTASTWSRSSSRRCASASDAIPLLVDFFLRKYNEQYRKALEPLSAETLARSHALPLAGQRPRAREHDEAHGRARERAGGAPGDRADGGAAHPRGRRRGRSTSTRSAPTSRTAAGSISRRSRSVPPRSRRRRVIERVLAADPVEPEGGRRAPADQLQSPALQDEGSRARRAQLARRTRQSRGGGCKIVSAVRVLSRARSAGARLLLALAGIVGCGRTSSRRRRSRPGEKPHRVRRSVPRHPRDPRVEEPRALRRAGARARRTARSRRPSSNDVQAAGLTPEQLKRGAHARSSRST